MPNPTKPTKPTLVATKSNQCWCGPRLLADSTMNWINKVPIPRTPMVAPNRGAIECLLIQLSPGSWPGS